MAVMEQPVTDLVAVYETAVSPTVDHRGVDLPTRYGKVPRGLLIATDGELTLKMGSATTRVFPAGTFATGVIHAIMIQEVVSCSADGVYIAIDL